MFYDIDCMFNVLNTFIQQLPRDAAKRKQEFSDIELRTRVGIALGLAIVFAPPEQQKELKSELLMDMIFVADVHRKPETTARILKDAGMKFSFPEDKIQHIEVGTYINSIVNSVTGDQHLVSFVNFARRMEYDPDELHLTIRGIYFDGFHDVVTKIQKEDEPGRIPVDGSPHSRR